MDLPLVLVLTEQRELEQRAQCFALVLSFLAVILFRRCQAPHLVSYRLEGSQSFEADLTALVGGWRFRFGLARLKALAVDDEVACGPCVGTQGEPHRLA